MDLKTFVHVSSMSYWNCVILRIYVFNVLCFQIVLFIGMFVLCELFWGPYVPKNFCCLTHKILTWWKLLVWLRPNQFLCFCRVVSVGGDGLFAEVVDGLLTRTMKEDGTDLITPDTNLLQPRWRIGIIPAGQSVLVTYYDLYLLFYVVVYSFIYLGLVSKCNKLQNLLWPI